MRPLLSYMIRYNYTVIKQKKNKVIKMDQNIPFG